MGGITYFGWAGGDAAQVQLLLDKLSPFGWFFDWGMFISLFFAGGVVAWIFIDSAQKRRADKALTPRILSLVGLFMIMPAFIFKFTGNADGVTYQVKLLNVPGTPVLVGEIPWNVKWLLAGYGPLVAVAAFVGVALAILSLIIYASTVSRSRPSTEFVSALNSQFGDLRQEIQSVKSRQASAAVAPTVAPAGVPGKAAAATMIDRPSSGAATIIEGAGGAELRAVSGPAAGRSWRLPLGDAKIGREASNLVYIEDAKASREHARIRFTDGVYTITDTGSSNGTFVNERRVSGQMPLSDGDTVRIGDTTLAFRAGA